ncbi:RNA polymerase sigma factor [Lentibacillus halophilus]|uniref:RNA polymerase sigma factor n=1 Tax=Lentibacillus halophilus TaxID=295065 RepID=A0ABP3J1L8_9BACI
MEAFKQLYVEHYQHIHTYLFYLTGRQSLADELTQETFLQAFKSIHRFKGQSAISTWLFQIAKHVFYKQVRKEEKHKQLIKKTEQENSVADATTPEKIYEQKETSIQLLTAIRQLKQPHQDIVILRSYNELDYKAIADIFNQSETWARVNFYRAKNKLITIMDGGGMNEE